MASEPVQPIGRWPRRGGTATGLDDARVPLAQAGRDHEPGTSSYGMCDG